MNKERNLWILLPFLTAASTAKAHPAIDDELGQHSGQRPNIIYIMSDDHSYQTISCYDRRYIHTPHIDQIAQQGVKFTNSFVTNSISGPSRAVMLTGKFSHKNGKKDNFTDFDGSQPTFPKLLQEAGYQTAIFGKWHLKTEPTGFDSWEILPGQGQYYNPLFNRPQGDTIYPGYCTRIVTDLSLNWLEQQRSADQPFCLIIHHKAPHRNWMPDTTELSLFEDVEFPLPETFWDDYQGRAAAAAQQMSIEKDMDLVFDLKIDHPSLQTPYRKNYSLARLSPEQRRAWEQTYDPIIQEFVQAELTGKELTAWKFQRYMRDYLKCIKSLDDNIGRVMNYLRENNLLDNTIVVYTSDQGFYMGEHGWFDKRFMYEESLRTPLVMHLPQHLSLRGEIPQFVQNIDYAPTFLELAGVEIPSDVQGKSLVPLLSGHLPPQDWRTSVYYHYYEYPAEHAVRQHYGVRNERYKLIRFYGHDIEQWELYDLQTDPQEMNNRYDDPEMAFVRQTMHRELERLREQYDDREL